MEIHKKLTGHLVPLVDGEVVITSYRDDGWNRNGWVRIRRNVCDRRIRQEFHYHTYIFLDCWEHHWRLTSNITKLTSRIDLMNISQNKLATNDKRRIKQIRVLLIWQNRNQFRVDFIEIRPEATSETNEITPLADFTLPNQHGCALTNKRTRWRW